MSRYIRLVVATLLAACAAAAITSGTGFPFAAGQDQEAEEERDEATRDPAARAEQLERRLDQIGDLIKQAEQRNDEERSRTLRREAERVLDLLEEIERSREGDERDEEEVEWEHHLRELEVHRLELENERLHLEMLAARQESALKLVNIASDEVHSAAYAVSQAVELLGPERAIPFLDEMATATENETVARMIRHQLVVLHREVDRPDAAKQELRALILGR